MKWKIVTDSGCDIPETEIDRTRIGYECVPFIITVGEEDYIDNKNLKIEEMLRSMEESQKAGKTACPSPAAWMSAYEGAEQVIVITMSGALSGSYRSAVAARHMFLEQYPDRHIHVWDSKMAGSGIGILVREVLWDIQAGKEYEAIAEHLKETIERTHIIFALVSFQNLIKAGRMHWLVGYAVNKLKLCVIGKGTQDGRLEILHKIRGTGRIYEKIVKAMTEQEFTEGEVIISHCFNRKGAEQLAHMIKHQFPKVRITILNARGICSYYAERGGLIVAFLSCQHIS